MKRIVTLSLIIIIVSIGLVLETDYYLKTKKTLDQQNTDQDNSNPALVYQAAGIKAVDCLENQTALPEQIWVLSKIYSQTKTNKYLDLLSNRIGQLSSTPKFNSPLLCKMFSEVANNDFIKEDQKETLKNICLNSSTLKTQNNLIQKIKSDSTDLYALFHTRNDAEKKIFEEKDDLTDIAQLALLSSENLGKFVFSKDSATLKNGQAFFQQAYKTFVIKRNWEYVDACTLASASLDNYNINGDKLYLEITNDIFNQIKTVDGIKNINLSTKSACSNFFTRYFKLAQNSEAERLNRFLLDDSIEINFDDKEFPSYRSDSKCFIDYDNKTPSFENSLIISSLIETK